MRAHDPEQTFNDYSKGRASARFSCLHLGTPSIGMNVWGKVHCSRNVYGSFIVLVDATRDVSLRNTRFIGTYRSETANTVRSTIAGKAQILARSETVIYLDNPLIETHDLELLLQPAV